MDAGEHNKIVAALTEEARTAFLRGCTKGYIYGLKAAVKICNAHHDQPRGSDLLTIEKEIISERAAKIPKDIALEILLEDLISWITYNHRSPARQLMEMNVELIRQELARG